MKKSRTAGPKALVVVIKDSEKQDIPNFFARICRAVRSECSSRLHQAEGWGRLDFGGEVLRKKRTVKKQPRRCKETKIYDPQSWETSPNRALD